jgi:hypothetical protein
MMRNLPLAQRYLGPAFVVLLLITTAFSDTALAQSNAVAPTLIPLTGQLRTPDGAPRTGSVLLVLSLYEGRDDTAPRWIEHQTVTLDAGGRYSVQFGATRDDGLPSDLFAGVAGTRWVGVAVESEAEQPRVTLISVPYAAKAASADMLSGKPLTDFVLTSTLHEDVRAVLQEDGGSATAAAVAGGLNYLQKGDGAAGTTDSGVFETGDNVGIGTTTPLARLHLRAPLNLPSMRLENTEAGAATWQLTSASDGQLRFTEVGVATRFVINKTTGTIGIGTSTPASLLHLRAGLNLPSFRLENIEAGGATWQVTSANDGQFRVTEVGAATRLVLAKTSGNFGIGTGAPASKLHVVGTTTLGGDTTISGNAAVTGTTTLTGATTLTGNATINGDLTVSGNIGAKYQDVAEWVDAAEPLEPGTVVIVDSSANNRVSAAFRSYDSGVAGAVSPQPGLILGERGEGKVLVAHSGRVRIKVDAAYGAVKRGDLLVSSPTKGHAMRADARKVRPGTVIGKALEPLPAGRGEILALLTLQ